MKMFSNHHVSLRAKRSNLSWSASTGIASSLTFLAMTTKRIVKSERGQALPMALILLLLGGFLVVPSLVLMNTSLIANRLVDRANLELYSADAGVENVLWSIQDDPSILPTEVGGSVPVDFPDQTINRMDSVTTTITNLGNRIYRITSTATSTSPNVHSTQVQSYILAGNLDLFNCALASPSDIYLKKECIVDGNIYCGGTLTPSDFEPINGDMIKEGMEFPTDAENQAFADKYKADAMQGGTHTGDMTIPIGNGTVTDLGPLYITGNLSVRKNNIINLTGTIYVKGYIDVDLDAEFTGTGSIVAVEDISLSKMSNYGTEGTSIIMSLNGDITFKKECDVAALIYAPEGSVSFDKDASITGAVIAGEGILADKEGTFSLDSRYYDTLELPGYGSNITVKTYAINPPVD